ncbi:SHOCT domain-containing protein (plasmid) [Deinococcus sp. KNUC1210]|uniref:SHOCT domain-containing protein n=1 Tax=Deinococcus sp. KNUC1210 TaxID=2917691 RepID=UPI001EF13DA1|nr:SHOCT domain-containing protein [Deinococcus sp. KNUC1210]ULH14211.1 SHOCT domain-containing protein [Deinococcus sp. KNUC1210]
MDVIINNAQSSAQPLVQVPQLQGTYPLQSQPAPYGYGYDGPQEHGFGGGFLVVAAVIGGVLLLKMRRRRAWMMQRMGSGPRPFGPGGGARTPEQTAADWKDTLQRGKERLFGDRALDIARERYARGEISTEEYSRLQRDLSAEGRPGQDPSASSTPTDAPGLKLHKDEPQ